MSVRIGLTTIFMSEKLLDIYYDPKVDVKFEKN